MIEKLCLFEMDGLLHSINRIDYITDTKWNIDEKLFFTYIGINDSNNNFTIDKLSTIIIVIRKGFFGNKKNGTWISTNLPIIDCRISVTNIPRLHYFVHGHFGYQRKYKWFNRIMEAIKSL